MVCKTLVTNEGPINLPYLGAYEEVVINFASQVRRDKLGGREYLVAPASMLVPGVLNGSKGPLYYPRSEVVKNYTAWNGMPLTLGHPNDDDGTPSSARRPEILEKYGLGFVFNASVKKGKLDAEAWFDVDRTNKLSPQILRLLENGTPVELSTGLFTDNFPVKNGSEYRGKYYSAVARNYQPDHLAVLVGSKGACSLEDGCGVLVNEAVERNCPVGNGWVTIKQDGAEEGSGVHVFVEGGKITAGPKGLVGKSKEGKKSPKAKSGKVEIKGEKPADQSTKAPPGKRYTKINGKWTLVDRKTGKPSPKATGAATGSKSSTTSKTQASDQSAKAPPGQRYTQIGGKWTLVDRKTGKPPTAPSKAPAAGTPSKTQTSSGSGSAKAPPGKRWTQKNGKWVLVDRPKPKSKPPVRKTNHTVYSGNPPAKPAAPTTPSGTPKSRGIAPPGKKWSNSGGNWSLVNKPKPKPSSGGSGSGGSGSGGSGSGGSGGSTPKRKSGSGGGVNSPRSAKGSALLDQFVSKHQPNPKLQPVSIGGGSSQKKFKNPKLDEEEELDENGKPVKKKTTKKAATKNCAVTNLALAKTDGVWRTIKGSRVFIEDGVVTKGPKSLKGKTQSQAVKSSSSTKKKDKTVSSDPLTPKEVDSFFTTLGNFAKATPKEIQNYAKKRGWVEEKDNTKEIGLLQDQARQISKARKENGGLLENVLLGRDKIKLAAYKIGSKVNWPHVTIDFAAGIAAHLAVMATWKVLVGHEANNGPCPDPSDCDCDDCRKRTKVANCLTKKCVFNHTPGGHKHDQKSHGRKKKVGTKSSASISKLPEKPDAYFNLDKPHVMLNLDDLVRAHDRPKGNANAAKYMEMALKGEGKKRDPITVRAKKDGTLEVVDGNSTTYVARDNSWKQIPAVLEMPEGMFGKDYVNDPYLDTWDELIDKAKETMDDSPDSYQSLLDKGKGLVDDLGGKVVSYAESKKLGHKGPVVVFGPLKGLERAKEKVETKYGGNWNRLSDVVRGAVIASPTQVEQIKSQLEQESKERGWSVVEFDNKMEHPTPVKYRDASFKIRSPQGLIAELQVVTPNMWIAKTGHGHKLYEEWRSLTNTGKTMPTKPALVSRVNALVEEQKELYESAWERDQNL